MINRVNSDGNLISVIKDLQTSATDNKMAGNSLSKVFSWTGDISVSRTIEVEFTPINNPRRYKLGVGCSTYGDSDNLTIIKTRINDSRWTVRIDYTGTVSLKFWVE